MLKRKHVIEAGIVLLLINFLHTAYVMTRLFNLYSDGASEEQIEQQMSAASSFGMSPPFIVMTNVGILLVIVGLFMRRPAKTDRKRPLDAE
jgi:uncharacterized membrane protein